MASKQVPSAKADSAAVLVIRKAQRCGLAPTGMAHATHRITANTGWARRSSAKAAVLSFASRARAAPYLVFPQSAWLYSLAMSIRRAGGDWEPMLLGIEPRLCKVCKQGLYRDKTMLRGGWSRCTVCDEFVHYSCLASGKVKFLKRRPRVCLVCQEAADRSKARVQAAPPPDVAVGS